MLEDIDEKYSVENKRISVEEFVEKLCEYEVISFDVFDTLILRPFSSPRVLFSIMEKRLGIYKFSKIRVDSEDLVRNEKKKRFGHDNVSLLDIYEAIAKQTNLNAEETAQLEFNLEKTYCFANPYFKEIVSKCSKSSKKMIVCSDMYLSESQIRGLLSKVGYSCFSEIYVSSELNKSKKKGDMFHFLKEQYPKQKIIHVGDDLLSDIENATIAGIDSYYYKNNNEIGGKNRITDMSYIAGRIYSALINNRLYCGNEDFDESYKLGFIYGGMYVLGFTQWVNKFAIDHDVDKILFLSRDGDVYSKMYDMLPNHKAWQYFHWSRLAGVKITAMENFYEFCQRMIWHKARGVYNIKIGHVLHFFKLDHLIPKLNDYNLTSTSVLSKETASAVEQLFYDNKTSIIEEFQSDINAAMDCIKKTVGNSKRVAIVDVGWAGTGPLIIKKAIKTYLNLDCEVFSLLAGYRQPIENMESLYVMDGSIHSYLFSHTSNRDLLDLHINGGSPKNNLLLEIFTQSCTPSFLGYTSDGLTYDREELQNYEIIKKINEGTKDFVRSYLKTYKEDPFLLNISAYDAYLPFYELANSCSRLNSILSKLVISRGVFYDAENASEESWLSFFYKDE